MVKFFTFLNLMTLSALCADNIYDKEENLNQILKHNYSEPNYFTLLLGLFLVIALVYVTGFIYLKLTKIKLGNQPDFKNKVQILSTTPLGQNKNLHIIKINDKYLLIGATQNNITYLKELELDNGNNV